MHRRAAALTACAGSVAVLAGVVAWLVTAQGVRLPVISYGLLARTVGPYGGPGRP